MASDSDGFWNSVVDEFVFEIAPAFWERGGFECRARLHLGIRRLGLLSHSFNPTHKAIECTFEERFAERTLIAKQ